MDKAATTAASFQLHLGEREFSMRPLSDGAIGALDQWMRSEYVRAVSESTRGLPDRVELLRVAFSQLPSMRAFDESGRRTMATPRGLAKLVLVSSNSPDALFDELEALLHDPGNVALVNEAFAYLNPKPRGNAAGRTKGPASRTTRSTRR